MKKNLGLGLVMAMFACMCMLVPVEAAAQHTVSGNVTWKIGKVRLKTGNQDMAGKPVVGAKVRLGPGNYTATTDASGNFSIANIPAGTYTMHVKAKEHSSISKVVVVNGNQTIDVRLLWRNMRLGKANRNVQG